MRASVAAAVLVVALLAGCADDEESEVVGSPADVQTMPGVYDGYAVANGCDWDSMLAVTGTGTSWIGGVAPTAEGRAEALDLWGQETLGPALEDLSSVWAVGGYGLSCHQIAGMGPTVHTNDWTDVDAIIQRVGALLRDEGLQDEVAILVGGIPEAE
jgi:hypothetical protein